VFARLVVRLAVLGVPATSRERFVREWRAELVNESLNFTAFQLLRHACGAFPDAWALRRVAREASARKSNLASWLGAWANDARVAARSLRRSPGFTLATVVTLAIGMGGSAAIYTLLDSVVLDPLPYPEPEQLVEISNRVPGVAPGTVWHASTAQQMFYDENASSLQAVGLTRALGFNMDTPEGPTRTSGWRITASVFPMLGATARLGRLISSADDSPGAATVVVMSNEIWQQRFRGDPDIVGKSITINGNPVDVIGVLEPGFAAPIAPPGYQSDLWIPFRIDPDGEFRNTHVFGMIGRLSPNVSPAAAEVELDRLERLLPERFPRAYSEGFFRGTEFYTQVVPLKESVVGDMARNLWILFGSVGLVLLIACANVANLFVVRLDGRGRELAVRQALGAPRTALARFLLAEGLLLSITGAALALILGWVGVPALLEIAPESLPRFERVQMDEGTVLFTVALALIIGMSLGVFSLFRHQSEPAVGSLAGGRAFSAGKKRQRFRAMLVVSQVALALTLIVGAGLLVESLRRLNSIDPGFEAEGVLTARLYLTPQRYDSDVQIWRTYSQILDRVRALPGVIGAGMSEELPVEGSFGCTVQGFEEQAVYDRLNAAGLGTCAGQERATPGYFDAMAIPVLQGHELTDADHLDPTRAAVVVSQAFADRFWPGENAIGKGVAPSGRTVEPFYRVVGVVGDHPAEALDGDPAISIYYPVVHDPNTPSNWGWWRPTTMALVVKTGLPEPMSLLPAIRQAVRAIDPSIPIVSAQTMDDVVAQSTARFSFVSALLGIAAIVALTLAAVGVYGVVSYVVSRSTREIGMRVALGARPIQVEAHFVRQSLVFIGIGLVVGLGLAAATTRVLAGMLYGVEPTDPGAFVLASAVLAFVALVASWLPARRAAKVDPMEALRAD
jgi:predicted permease